MTESLYRLIKSLTPVEKREFKKAFLMKSRTQDYYRLYDYLNTLRSFRGEKEVDQAAAENLGKPLEDMGRIKKNLRDKLFEYLVKSTKEPLNQIYHFLQAAQILRRKKIYELSVHALKRAKKIAWEFEEFDTLDTLYVFERKFPEAFQSKKLAEQLDHLKLAQSEIEGIEKVKDILRNWVKDKNLPGPKISLIETVLKNPLIASDRDYRTEKGKIKAIHIRRLATSLSEQWSLALPISIRYLRMIESSKAIHEEKEELMMNELWDLSSHYIILEDYHGYFSTLKQLKRLGEKYPSIQIRANYFSNLASIFFASEYGYPEIGFEALKSVYSDWDRTEIEIERKNILQLQFFIIRMLFTFQKFKKAMFWIEDFYAMSSRDGNYPILYPYVAIIELLILLELGDLDELTTRLKSLQRYLKNNPLEFEFFTIVVKTIQKIPGLPVLFRPDQYLESANALSELRNDSFQSRPFNYLQLDHYFESLGKNIPFGDNLKQKKNYDPLKEDRNLPRHQVI